MADTIIDKNCELEKRKKQAIELNIDVEKDVTLESLEKEISSKLELGMQDIKNILDEISLLEH